MSCCWGFDDMSLTPRLLLLYFTLHVMSWFTGDIELAGCRRLLWWWHLGSYLIRFLWIIVSFLLCTTFFLLVFTTVAATNFKVLLVLQQTLKSYLLNCSVTVSICYACMYAYILHVLCMHVCVAFRFLHMWECINVFSCDGWASYIIPMSLCVMLCRQMWK